MFKRFRKVIYVDGMKCEGCVNRVRQAMLFIPFVKSCIVSLEDGKVELVLNREVDDFIIYTKIEELGFRILD